MYVTLFFLLDFHSLSHGDKLKAKLFYLFFYDDENPKRNGREETFAIRPKPVYH